MSRATFRSHVLPAMGRGVGWTTRTGSDRLIVAVAGAACGVRVSPRSSPTKDITFPHPEVARTTRQTTKNCFFICLLPLKGNVSPQTDTRQHHVGENPKNKSLSLGVRAIQFRYMLTV